VLQCVWTATLLPHLPPSSVWQCYYCCSGQPPWVVAGSSGSYYTTLLPGNGLVGVRGNSCIHELWHSLVNNTEFSHWEPVSCLGGGNALCVLDHFKMELYPSFLLCILSGRSHNVRLCPLRRYELLIKDWRCVQCRVSRAQMAQVVHCHIPYRPEVHHTAHSGQLCCTPAPESAHDWLFVSTRNYGWFPPTIPTMVSFQK